MDAGLGATYEDAVADTPSKEPAVEYCHHTHHCVLI
jgi:hypothetical protein